MIDGFLSHSWHASWILKYLVLLFHFNSWPAAFAVGVFGFTVSLSSMTSDALLGDFAPAWTEWQNFTAAGDLAEECPGTRYFRFFVLPVGMFLFISVLTNYHWFAKCCRIGPMIFFDKVCIHQTNPELKEAGIKSIGGILQNSKELILAWDTTYFQRLWCTYELSAFLHKHKPIVDGTKTSR